MKNFHIMALPLHLAQLMDFSLFVLFHQQAAFTNIYLHHIDVTYRLKLLKTKDQHLRKLSIRLLTTMWRNHRQFYQSSYVKEIPPLEQSYNLFNQFDQKQTITKKDSFAVAYPTRPETSKRIVDINKSKLNNKRLFILYENYTIYVIGKV